MLQLLLRWRRSFVFLLCGDNNSFNEVIYRLVRKFCGCTGACFKTTVVVLCRGLVNSQLIWWFVTYVFFCLAAEFLNILVNVCKPFWVFSYILLSLVSSNWILFSWKTHSHGWRLTCLNSARSVFSVRVGRIELVFLIKDCVGTWNAVLFRGFDPT